MALRGITIVLSGTLSPSAETIALTSAFSSNSSSAIPSKHFLRCGCRSLPRIHPIFESISVIDIVKITVFSDLSIPAALYT